MNIVIGIPARYASSRFPGKPLAKIAGKSMIEHVILRAHEAGIGKVFVATDDKRIYDVAHATGVEVVMTRADHASGSERLAEAVREMDCDIVVNVQGDEPLIDPAAIRAVVEPFRSDHYLPMATLAKPIASDEDFRNPNIVKVVCDDKGRARYFSRAPIPFPRSGSHEGVLQHVGLYAYRKEFLLIYSTLTPCMAEENEQLEQLRVLHHGYDIAVTTGNFTSHGVDTPEDLARAESLLS